MFLSFLLYLCIWISEHFSVWALTYPELLAFALYYNVPFCIVVGYFTLCVIRICNVQVIQINIIIIIITTKTNREKRENKQAELNILITSQSSP